VESDATPPPPDRTISFEITLAVTQGGDHVAYHDAEDDGDQEYAMGDNQEFIALEEPGEIYMSPVGSQLT